MCIHVYTCGYTRVYFLHAYNNRMYIVMYTQMGVLMHAVLVATAITIMIVLVLAVTNCAYDGFSDADKKKIAEELHEKKHIFGGNYRDARSEVKSIALDPVLFEDIRVRSPSTTEEFESLLR